MSKPPSHFDRLAAEGMTLLLLFYANRVAAPGRGGHGHAQVDPPTGSGIPLWAFQGQAAVCRQRSGTLASVLKQADPTAPFSRVNGIWGESRLCAAQCPGL